MDPTEGERSAIHNINDLFVWAGLTDTAGHVKESAIRVLGLEPGNPLRDLASIQEADLEAALNSWVVNFDATTTLPASPTNKGRVRNAWRVAAVLMGTHVSVAQQQQLLQQQLQHQQQPQQQQQPDPRGNTVRLDLVVDQALSREVPSLSDDEIQECFVEYKKRMGAMPTEEEEPDAEQLTGVAHLLRSGVPPYVDFALFGPHQLRTHRKLKFSGFILSAEGTFQSVELLGPPKLEDWVAAYRILGVCLIMLKAVTPARVQRYQQHIIDCASRFSSAVWSIIYQADVRMRREHMQALRRLALEQIVADPVAAANRGITKELMWEHLRTMAVNRAAAPGRGSWSSPPSWHCRTPAAWAPWCKATRRLPTRPRRPSHSRAARGRRRSRGGARRRLARAPIAVRGALANTTSARTASSRRTGATSPCAACSRRASASMRCAARWSAPETTRTCTSAQSVSRQRTAQQRAATTLPSPGALAKAARRAATAVANAARAAAPIEGEGGAAARAPSSQPLDRRL